MVPRKFFLTKGMGVDKDHLLAFDLALREAGISKFNLVPVSSILPPKCKMISKKEGLRYLKAGEIVFCVLSRKETNKSKKIIGASIGCAIPAKNHYGYIAEYNSFGQSEEELSKHVENLAVSMLASSLGISLDLKKFQHKREKFFKLLGNSISTTNVTQVAESKRNGYWTCVVAAAVFIP
jgi:arginine decarboxylase